MKASQKTRIARRNRLHARIRRRIVGCEDRPRFSVSFSGQHIYAQLIDDTTSKTMVSVSTTEKKFNGETIGPNVDGAVKVGQLIAERAKEKGIEAVVFDRGGFRYHGKVKALADAAREAGLKF